MKKVYGAYSDAVPDLMPLADINENRKVRTDDGSGMKPDDYHKAVAAKEPCQYRRHAHKSRDRPENQMDGL